MKLGKPLKVLSITQTYHSNSSNTAIDLSAVTGTPVYAVADGKVTYRSSLYGSYCIQTLSNSDLKVYYVHTYKWVGANTFVKKGDIICYIAPPSVNGGYPTHLHIGLQAGKYIMDYFDRSLVFTTKYADIMKSWFKSGKLNWSLFKDLNYLSNSMKKGDKVIFTDLMNIRSGAGDKFSDTGDIKKGAVGIIHDGPRSSQNEQFGKGKNDNYTWWDIYFLDKTGWVADTGRMEVTTKAQTQLNGTIPTPPPTESPEALQIKELQNEVKTLKEQISAVESSREALVKEIEALTKEKKENKALLEQYKIDMTTQLDKYEELLKEKNRIMGEKGAVELKYDKLKRKYEEGNKNFIKKITDWIGEILSNITK